MRYPRYPVLRHIPFFHQRERGIELAGFYDLGYPQNSPINQNKINICTVVATAIAILWDCKYLTDGIHCWKITGHLENGVTNRWFRYDRLGPAVQLHQCTNNNYGMEVSTGGTPIASWFRMENPMKECMSLGVPPFRKPPFVKLEHHVFLKLFWFAVSALLQTLGIMNHSSRRWIEKVWFVRKWDTNKFDDFSWCFIIFPIFRWPFWGYTYPIFRYCNRCNPKKSPIHVIFVLHFGA